MLLAWVGCIDSYDAAFSHFWPNADTAHLAHTADSFAKAAVKASAKTKITKDTWSKHLYKQITPGSF